MRIKHTGHYTHQQMTICPLLQKITVTMGHQNSRSNGNNSEIWGLMVYYVNESNDLLYHEPLKSESR